MQLGVKLASGAIDETFVAGPQAGESVDRGLQPETGTTDLLLGAYHYGALGERFNYFAQALVQQSLALRDGFKPGTGFKLSIGLHYLP